MNDFYGLEKLIEDNGGIENFRCFTQMGFTIVNVWPTGYVINPTAATDKQCVLTVNLFYSCNATCYTEIRKIT